MDITFILCRKKAREALVDEFVDWKDRGVQVALSGITHKGSNGFIFLEWSKPIPDLFHDKMKQDTDILDYITMSGTADSTTLAIV